MLRERLKACCFKYPLSNEMRISKSFCLSSSFSMTSSFKAAYLKRNNCRSVFLAWKHEKRNKRRDTCPILRPSVCFLRLNFEQSMLKMARDQADKRTNQSCTVHIDSIQESWYAWEDYEKRRRNLTWCWKENLELIQTNLIDHFQFFSRIFCYLSVLSLLCRFVWYERLLKKLDKIEDICKLEHVWISTITAAFLRILTSNIRIFNRNE